MPVTTPGQQLGSAGEEVKAVSLFKRSDDTVTAEGISCQGYQVVGMYIQWKSVKTVANRYSVTQEYMFRGPHGRGCDGTR